MAWNPNLDVLSGILGDARQYVDQHTREKKAASIKFLDRVYAEEQLGKARQYQEDVTGRNRQYQEDLTDRERDYFKELLGEERTYKKGLLGEERTWQKGEAKLERERKEQAALQALYRELGMLGPEQANMGLSEAGRAAFMTQREKFLGEKDADRTLQRTLTQANINKADRMHLATDPTPPPPFLSPRLTGPALAEEQNRALSDMRGPGGPLDLGLHNPELSESFRQLIAADQEVWQEGFRNIAGKTGPIPFLDSVKILVRSEDPATVAGYVNNIKARMIPIIKGIMTKQLQKFDDHRFNKLSDEGKKGFLPYASALESGMDRQAEQIFNDMIHRMMFDPTTGAISESGKGQSAGTLSLQQIERKAREERRANLTHEERWLEDITGTVPNKKQPDQQPSLRYRQHPTQ